MRTIAPASAVQTVSLANDDDGLMRLEEKCNGCTHTCGPPSSNPRRRGSLATSAGGVGWLEAPPPLPALLARRVSYCNTCSAAKSASRRVARLARRSTHRSDGGPHELTDTRGERQHENTARTRFGEVLVRGSGAAAARCCVALPRLPRLPDLRLPSFTALAGPELGALPTSKSRMRSSNPRKRSNLAVEVSTPGGDEGRPLPLRRLTTPDCMSSPVSHLRDLTRDLEEDGAKRRRAAQYLRETREVWT